MNFQRNFKVFRGKEGLGQLEEDWRNLCHRLPNPQFFHHFDWYSSYVDALLEAGTTLYFVALYEAGELQAVFPLQKRRQRAFGMERHILELPHYFRLRLWDFIVAPAAAHAGTFRALRDFLARTPELRWHVLRLREVMEAGAADRLIRSERVPLLIAEPAGYSSVMPFLAYDETRGRLSKKSRENLKSAQNRAKRVGARFLCVRDPEGLRTLYRELVRIEGSGWKGAAGTAMRCIPGLMRFFDHVVTRMGAQGYCEINALEVDGKIVSAQLGTVTGNVYCGQKIAYDKAYARLSPGHLLVDDIMRRYAGHRDVRLLNLITDGAWQKDWRPDRVAVFDYYVYRPSLQGLLAYLSYGGRLAQHGFVGWLRTTLSWGQAVATGSDTVPEPRKGVIIDLAARIRRRGRIGMGSARSQDRGASAA